MKIKKIVLLFSVSAVVLFFASCSKSSSNPMTGANTASVDISGMAFPATTTVKVGTTVVWNNKDAMAHTVTSDDGSTFSSGNLASGASFSYQAKTAGSFPYHCNYHSNMHGTLVVNP